MRKHPQQAPLTAGGAKLQHPSDKQGKHGRAMTNSRSDKAQHIKNPSKPCTHTTSFLSDLSLPACADPIARW